MKFKICFLEKGKKGKRGTIQDLLYTLIVLFALSIIILIVFKVSNSINDKLQESNLLNSNSEEAFQKTNNTFPGALNTGFLVLMVGLAVTSLVLASLVRVHPVFFIFYIIILALLIVFSAIFSNVYQEMAANSGFSAEADRLNIISIFMQGLPIFVGVFGVLLAIVMYKNYRGAGEI